MGWGVLLWSTENPPVPSGTMLPVYIKSNIDQVWVVGIPEEFRGAKTDVKKMEVPLSQFEFTGSKSKTRKYAAEFAPYARVYAENLHDGLPVRETPDNSARRVYRLRTGEVIKILNIAKGAAAISASGEPLPGDWYRVLTHDGIIGFCFSNRLKLFDNLDEPVQTSSVARGETNQDPDLDMVMSKTWSAESYLQMVTARRLNIAELEKKWRFEPGQDSGIAKIILPELEKEFRYEGIFPDGERAWRFEGANLQMHLRSNTTLAVQYKEDSGGMRTLLFVSLSSNINDLILQENARRSEQFAAIYDQGPKYSSNNYGTITFSAQGSFVWEDYDLLVPNLISMDATGSGRVQMDLFLTPSFEERYTGACTFRFAGAGAAFSGGSNNSRIRFMYSLDSQGIRLEVVPDYAVEDVTVTRRSSSPMVLYFYRETGFSGITP